MRKAEKHLSDENLSIIKKYDAEMVTLGLKKSTRTKQISLIVGMSIRIGKNWNEITKFHA